MTMNATLDLPQNRPKQQQLQALPPPPRQSRQELQEAWHAIRAELDECPFGSERWLALHREERERWAELAPLLCASPLAN